MIRIALALMLAASCMTQKTPAGDSKIDASLLMALNDPTSTSRALPFATEKAADGTTIVPVFVRSNDVAATKHSTG